MGEGRDNKTVTTIKLFIEDGSNYAGIDIERSGEELGAREIAKHYETITGMLTSAMSFVNSIKNKLDDNSTNNRDEGRGGDKKE